MLPLFQRLLRNRFMRFGGLGVLCLLFLQLPIMAGLIEVGFNAVVANGIGFVLSGVANYELQRRFTFDNGVKGSWLVGLGKFQLTSVFSLGVNLGVFAAVFYGIGSVFPSWSAVADSLMGGRLHAWAAAASFIGAVSGTGVNFVASRAVTFGHTAERPVDVQEVEQRPALKDLQGAVDGLTLVHFLPAYNEEANLPRVVQDLWAYLTSLGLFEFKIIIVNDGSKDRTGQVANALAAEYDAVEVIHHPKNMGYGAALITGFKAAVETGYNVWSFCDGDGQFAPQSLGTLLVQWARTSADMVVGRRLGRQQADSPFRLYLGRAWHLVSRVIVGRNADGSWLLSVTDVDCGLKVGSPKQLGRIVGSFRGQAAAISPELIAWANLAGQTIAECGVQHLPRKAGVSTGSNPKVMLRSMISIIWLGLRLRQEIYFGWMNNPAEDALDNLEG